MASVINNGINSENVNEATFVPGVPTLETNNGPEKIESINSLINSGEESAQPQEPGSVSQINDHGEPVGKIVDKTAEENPTTPLNKSHKLTGIADAQEDNFIQEVEAAHGHK